MRYACLYVWYHFNMRWDFSNLCAADIHLFSLLYSPLVWKPIIYPFSCWWTLDCFQFETKMARMVLFPAAELQFTFVWIYCPMPPLFFPSPHMLMGRKIKRVKLSGISVTFILSKKEKKSIQQIQFILIAAIFFSPVVFESMKHFFSVIS